MEDTTPVLIRVPESLMIKVEIAIMLATMIMIMVMCNGQ
jgi:hypothetical protein